MATRGDSELPTDLGLRRALARIAAAESAAQVLRSVQTYLSTWPRERVVRLQLLDGGWAPFDEKQRPSRINGVRDLQRVHNAVRRQCELLRQSAIAPNPELIELDEVLYVAVQAAQLLQARKSKAQSEGAA